MEHVLTRKHCLKKKSRRNLLASLKLYKLTSGRGLNSETTFHKPLQYVGISSCSLSYTKSCHLISLASFVLFSRTKGLHAPYVQEVVRRTWKIDTRPLRMPSISTVVHLSMLCHLQTKQISPLADASFPWFERRFFAILILLNKTDLSYATVN